MSDGRTDEMRDMWTRTTTRDSVEELDTTRYAWPKKAAEKNDLEYMPNQKWHQLVSFIKSGIRIAATVVAITYSLPLAFIILGIAEVVGIYEELV